MDDSGSSRQLFTCNGPVGDTQVGTENEFRNISDFLQRGDRGGWREGGRDGTWCGWSLISEDSFSSKSQLIFDLFLFEDGEELPDLVFVANAAVVRGKKAFLATFSNKVIIRSGHGYCSENYGSIVIPLFPSGASGRNCTESSLVWAGRIRSTRGWEECIRRSAKIKDQEWPLTLLTSTCLFRCRRCAVCGCGKSTALLWHWTEIRHCCTAEGR